MYTNLSSLITGLMKKIMKDENIVGKSVKSIIEIDVKDQSNFKSSNDIDRGYAESDEIRKNRAMFYKEDFVKFQKMAMSFITSVFKKLPDRCPLKYPMAKGASCLDPKMLSCSRNEGRLDIVLKELVHHKRLSGAEADAVKAEFSKMSNDPACLEKAINFNKSTDRLDDLWLGNILKNHSDSD